MSAARILPAGRSITSRDRPLIPIGSTPRRPAAGSDRSFSARRTAAKPGTSREPHPENRLPQVHQKWPATNSLTMRLLQPASRSPRINGMTEHSIPGNSSECGIWSRRSRIPIRSTPAWKTPPSSARQTGRPLHRPQMAAGRRRHVPAYHYSRSQQSAADVDRHLRSGRLPQ